MARYSQAAARGRDGQAVINEFKTMVKECHRRGIEVFMDVVFNHTAEGNEQGPSISFRCSSKPSSPCRRRGCCDACTADAWCACTQVGAPRPRQEQG